MSQPTRAVGICWYRRQHYARVQAVMADASVLPDTFNQWRKKAETGEQHLRAQGCVVHRIDLDPDAFLAWCTARNIDANADARMHWAHEAVVRMY